MMSRLTNEELLQVQTFIERGRRELEEQGLSVEIDTDLSVWASMLRRAPGSRWVASTHDPGYCNIHPGNAFWVIIRDTSLRWWERPLRKGPPIVACLCHRVIDTDDILDEIRTYRLFFDKKPSIDCRPVDIVAPKNTPTIGGRVGFGGGYWVHPKYRGKKISNALSRITRALSLRHFGIDWAIVFVMGTERRAKMVEHTVGIPHCVPLIKGYYPPYNIDYDIQMGYMHRDEIVRQIFEENRAAVEKQSLAATPPPSEYGGQRSEQAVVVGRP